MGGLVLLLGLALSPRIQDGMKEKEQPEMLPAPKESVTDAPPPRLVETFVPPYVRTSRYAVWDFYAVDRMGHFKPRVAYTPYGAFYLYNGAPYPWVTTHELDVMPHVDGTPYRSGD